ncbi:MAG: esterase family protein [Candidatus Latescibacteria bacterium]|nr:esterase family protein [Candidatus Latescibacterota bacterium]
MALLHANFYSNALQIAVSADIILPQEACLKGRKLPVLYLLHGLSDDHSIWQRRTSIERYVDPLGLAVVMPAVNRSFYADTAYGAQYWTFISEELPQLAQSFFPLSDKRADTFVAGLSMGGYGAFKLALARPDRFAAAASLSGALDMAGVLAEGARDEDEAWYQEKKAIFGDLAAMPGSGHDLLHLAQRLAQRKRRPALFQCCGTEDFLYKANVKFRKHAKKLGLEVHYEEGPGAHEWGYWDDNIQRVLDWLPLKGRK